MHYLVKPCKYYEVLFGTRRVTTIEIWSKKTGVGLVLVSLVHPFPPTGRNQLNVDCHSLSSSLIRFKNFLSSQEEACSVSQ